MSDAPVVIANKEVKKMRYRKKDYSYKQGSLRGSLILIMLVISLGFYVDQSSSEKPLDKVAKCKTQNSIKMAPSSVPKGGNIFFAEKETTTLPKNKVIIGTFLFSGTKVKGVETIVLFGTGVPPISERCDFSFELVDSQKGVLARYGIWDPRIQVVEEGEKKGVVEVQEASYSAVFPFSVKAKEVRVLDAGENIVATTDISLAIKKFCKEQKKDQECEQLMEEKETEGR